MRRIGVLVAITLGGLFDHTGPVDEETLEARIGESTS